MVADAGQGAGQRTPKDTDLDAILERVWSGKSLSSACRELGLHISSTSAWLHDDPDRDAQYARAREGRAEFLQEDSLAVNRAAALGAKVRDAAGQERKVDASGAKGYLEAVKFAIGRMAPKTLPPQRHEHLHEFGSLSDEDLDARIRAKEAALAGGSAAAADDDA